MKPYLYLTYAGLLPFIICSTCLALDIKVFPLLGATEKLLSIYSLVITTFMAGSHWGQHLNLDNKWSYYLPKLSNVLIIALFLGFLVLPFKLLLAAFIATLLILLVIDKKLVQHGLITKQYFHTRCLVTAIVVVTLIISGINA